MYLYGWFGFGPSQISLRGTNRGFRDVDGVWESGPPLHPLPSHVTVRASPTYDQWCLRRQKGVKHQDPFDVFDRRGS